MTGAIYAPRRKPAAAIQPMAAASVTHCADIGPIEGDFQLGNSEPGMIDWRSTTSGLAGGDTACLSTYYEAFFDVMFREARRLIGRDESTCLDVVHDAMLKSLRSIRPMDRYDQVAAWARCVVKSVAYDWLRKERRRQMAASDRTSDVAVSSETYDVELQARLSWIEEQLRQSPAELQEMIALRYRLGWTLQRIASQFGLKPGAVDGRIRRAVDELKLKAQHEYGD